MYYKLKSALQIFRIAKKFLCNIITVAYGQQCNILMEVSFSQVMLLWQRNSG